MPIGDSAMRDHLANERTLLAWVRTALALIAFGVAIEKFTVFLAFSSSKELPHHQSTFNHALSVGLLVASILLCIVGTARTLHWARNAGPPAYPMPTFPLLLAPGLTALAALALLIQIVVF